jgi:putative two-component system response regulator
LSKPGPLTYEERRIIQTHVSIGSKILSGSQYKLMQTAETVALFHHERWDGSGYPNGLSSRAIPMEARIVSIVDVYDALTNRRPYKDAWSKDDALKELWRCMGSQFDPVLVKLFISLVESDLASTG